MDYKQKYKEALETGKALHKNGAYRLLMEEIFPELAESEDETLRKTTISFLKDFAEKGYENAVECIDWLEKQKISKCSEQDKNMALTLMRDIDQVSFISKEGKDERIIWLNSLEERLCGEWKPTEYQLYWLKRVIPHTDTEEANEAEYALTGLYEEIKNLGIREE